MENKIPEILQERTNRLMTERYMNKKDMAERLGMEYLTFWRKLKGKRGIDVILLMKMAQILGTTVSYLVGETNSPEKIENKQHTNTQLVNDEKGNIVCEWGNNNRIVLPDNNETRDLLHNFFSELLDKGYISPENVPSNIFTVITVEVSSNASHEEIANAVSLAFSKAFPEAHVKFDVVSEKSKSENLLSNISAYNGNNSNYSGNSLTVVATA